MKRFFLGFACSLALIAAAGPTIRGDAPKRAEYLTNVQTGDPGLKSVGSINFGPQGLLLISDPQSAAIVAVQTEDQGPFVRLAQRIDDIYVPVASLMGAPKEGIQIVDMTVNPESGRIYLAAMRKADKVPAILTVDSDGKVKNVALEKVKYVRVELPGEGLSKIRNITDVEFASDRLVVAGQSGEEFASKVYSIPLPLKHGSSGNVFSTETFHVAHNKWETKAPIQQFVPVTENGKQYVVGSFVCTPLVKYELDDVKAGSKLVGESVVELGNGNRPLDMFTYERDGEKWMVTNTLRVLTQRGLFGPSKWWGVRVNMKYLGATNINEKAAKRDTSAKSGPEGIEIMDALFGAVQVAKLNNDEMVVLRADPETDTDARLALEVARLP